MRCLFSIPALFALALLTACANKAQLMNPASSGKSTPSGYPTVEHPVGGCAAGKNPFDCDRRAILAMSGGYEVQFKFDETVVLMPGYTRKEPKRSMGFEYVVLVEDAGRRISLQHILVMGNTVTKHWRQDWVYESPKRWVYTGNQHFEQQERDPAEIPGTWTQLVYEVNDGPRYSGSGKWNHRYGVSTWTSDRNWRPLPRREYTKRSDYQLINTENRQTITPQGWAHEQDNTKVIRTKDGKDTLLVREFGFNDYRRIEGYDFEPALAYWKATSEFWASVRARWDKIFTTHGSVTLSIIPADETFNMAVLELADAYRKNPQLDLYQAKLDDIFSKYVNVRASASVNGSWAHLRHADVFHPTPANQPQL
ncbi:DUF6607 family protein [Nitrosovibrio tenuis]|uniref:Uncharacterized protein n=1 Tax=Nitrosovibrio tenuis TaxID=1233 RepID=A0A1H7Q0H3_9PROT|nr:DUF6607 family protein [Nitrosovibrio tenuis]SEL41473.1 hypothetical protein SAMN05216387_11077 [Nitrosovibrio tenuis]